MLYNVAARITFDTAAHAKTAYDLIQSKWPLTSGREEDRAPELAIETDGSRTLIFNARLTSKTQRDALKDWLNDRKAWIKANTYGYISYHLCHHDTGGPCEDEKIITWGTPSV